MDKKWLVVNADDFGFTRDVNEGIIAAHQNGILTATTLMANGAAFEHAVQLARAHPKLDVGCHLVLIGGHSLLSGHLLPDSPAALLQELVLRRLSVYEELRQQVQRILEAGIQPWHLDTHKHTHVLPPVLSAVARLSREYGIPWVRRPFDLPRIGQVGGSPWSVRLASRVIGFGQPYAGHVLTRYGCRMTDHFAGFQLTGYLNTATLDQVLQHLPEGSTELMCHPGRLGDELRHAPTRLKESREIELQALTAPAVRNTLQSAEIQLVSYRDLSELT